jgi:uncharacterized protein YndB with AHSA1/START domain
MLTEREQYTPSPIGEPRVRKDREKWTLILTRDLQHSPEKVWQALTDPVHVREWAPFDVDGRLDSVGAQVRLTWVGTGKVSEVSVIQSDAPCLLEFGDIRWELEPRAKGTRFTLWHSIDRRFVAWGAAGWHISLDVLDRVLDGTPVARVAGPDAMKFEGWQRLVGEYKKLFGAE